MPGMDRPTPTEGTPDIATKVAFLQTQVGTPVRTVETHMSWVVLGPECVLKLKKPVRRPFLDFSTVAARAVNAREEVRLNRRLAPQVYQGLWALQWDGHAFSLVPEVHAPGPGVTVDWLVCMRRLPDEHMLDQRIRDGRVQPADIDALGAVLGPFYRGAPAVALTPRTHLDRMRHELRIDREVLLQPRFGLDTAAATLDRAQAALAAQAHAIGERVRSGHIVEGHGDLRPEHVCLIVPPVAIDCLEFNAAMRQVDPFDELVFLGLECRMLGAPWIGPHLIERCAGALRGQPPTALLDIYLARRALLRARLALAHLLEPRPRTPGKWLPMARRYLGEAGDALDRVMPARPHGCS